MKQVKKSQLKSVIKSIVRECINERTDKWIQKAVKPSHKGYCTPMTKSTCTPRRKALAKRFKSGDIHKDNVGESGVPPTQECGSMQQEAGLTSETGDGDEHQEKEEIMLIKAIGLAVKKLLDMHEGMEGSDEPVDVEIDAEEPVEEPEGGAEPIEEPSTGEEPSDENPFAKKSDEEEPEEVDEMKVKQKMGPSYKVVAKTQAQVTEPDQPARRHQFDPKVTESAYKVQGRSAKVYKDSPQLPKAQNDPKNA